MFDFSTLWAAPQPIAPHAMAAFAAMGVGALQFALPKGTLVHRIVGYVWVLSMAAVAVTSFFIYTIRLIGPFSPIHLLSAWTLYALFDTVRAARAGDIRRHTRGMKSLYGLALLVTGAFTLLPGRIMHGVLFGVGG